MIKGFFRGKDTQRRFKCPVAQAGTHYMVAPFVKECPRWKFPVTISRLSNSRAGTNTA
jgi:hypothetical protein